MQANQNSKFWEVNINHNGINHFIDLRELFEKFKFSGKIIEASLHCTSETIHNSDFFIIKDLIYKILPISYDKLIEYLKNNKSPMLGGKIIGLNLEKDILIIDFVEIEEYKKNEKIKFNLYYGFYCEPGFVDHRSNFQINYLVNNLNDIQFIDVV